MIQHLFIWAKSIFQAATVDDGSIGETLEDLELLLEKLLNFFILNEGCFRSLNSFVETNEDDGLNEDDQHKVIDKNWVVDEVDVSYLDCAVEG